MSISYEDDEREGAAGLDGDLGDLETLKRHEAFLINRRRRQETQHEAAARLGITRNNYVAMERGAKDIPEIPAPVIKRLFDHERCILYRRRCGWSQEQVAAESGMSRNWIRQQESGLISCDTLLGFWEN